MLKFWYILVIVVLIGSCKNAQGPETRPPDEIFQSALEKFKDEEYIEAKKLFDIIKLQYPASQWADDAHFYLAEVDYNTSKYVFAAYGFNRLRQVYPNSEYAKQSLFNAAMCFYKLSPSYERDQEYTKKAMQAFMEFQFLYPNDSLSEESNKKIDELRLKMAEKEFRTAILYQKLSQPQSSLIYFETVMNDFDDTEFYEPAFWGKIESLLLLRRAEEATTLLDLYKKRFPGKRTNDISSKEQEIKNLSARK